MTASHLAREERARLCTVLTESGQDAPTLCEGWLTKDLAAHLYVREHRPLAMPGIMLGGACVCVAAIRLCGPGGQGALGTSSGVAAVRRARQCRRVLRAHRGHVGVCTRGAGATSQ
ncbi:MAG: maleylpyruvate isomerase N-terminal domain-containing protein [Acidimicrobiales bacterium]